MKNTLLLQRKYYNGKVAAGFDRKRMNANHRYKIEVIEGFFCKYCRRKNNLRILEMGGGTGLHAEHFLEKESGRIAEFIFCDLSEDMLKIAEKRLRKYKKKIKFAACGAENFQYDKRLDCIYISGAMHHFEDPVKAIQNCYKHLADDGILILCEPVITNPYAWPRVIFKPEEYGQFAVTPRHILSWLDDNQFQVLDKKWMHYKSNHKFFRFLLKLEKVSFLNWSAVMFAAAARKQG